MKYLACLLTLIVTSVSIAGPDEDIKVATALAAAYRPVSTSVNVNPCLDPTCDCGCADGKPCKCLSQKNYAEDPEYKEFLAWKASRNKKAESNPTTTDDELSKSYAKDWIAQGWQYDSKGKHWFQYPSQSVTIPTYSFGNVGACSNGSCGVGGCSNSSCGSQSFSPIQSYQPSYNFSPSFQGNYGGGFSGFSGGGCANGSCGSR